MVPLGLAENTNRDREGVPTGVREKLRVALTVDVATRVTEVVRRGVAVAVD